MYIHVHVHVHVHVRVCVCVQRVTIVALLAIHLFQHCLHTLLRDNLLTRHIALVVTQPELDRRRELDRLDGGRLSLSTDERRPFSVVRPQEEHSTQ